VNIISSFFSYPSAVAYSFVFVVLFSGLIFLILKGAYFIFFNKLWSFFHRDEFYDSYLDVQREKALDVERFKIMFGVNRVDDIQTVKDAHRAVRWSEASSIALRTLGKAGAWVNWKEQKIDKPTAIQMIVLYLFLFVAIFFTALFAALTINSEAIIQFKESRVWAWQSEKGLRSFMASRDKRWVYDLSDCSRRDETQTLPVLPSEVNFVCAAAESGDYYSRLNATVKSQRYFGVPILIYLLLSSVFLFRKLQSLITALRLHRALHPCRCGK